MPLEHLSSTLVATICRCSVQPCCSDQDLRNNHLLLRDLHQISNCRSLMLRTGLVPIVSDSVTRTECSLLNIEISSTSAVDESNDALLPLGGEHPVSSSRMEI